MRFRPASLISLGCVKNLVDSEMMVPQLTELGFEMTDDLSIARVIVVNTCGFLESAVEEAIATILQAASHKQNGSCDCLVAVGCMVQRYGKKLLPLLPEVDLFIGTSHSHRLGAAVASWHENRARRVWIGPPRQHFDRGARRCRATQSPFAYVKIAEGCSNRCSYCLIPRLRGPYRSRAMSDVLQEANRLASEGVRELNLVAQDSTAFGLDLGVDEGLSRLLEALETDTSLEWIRLLYCYPHRITDTLLRTMAQSERVLPYLDVPFQHCVPRVLEGMGRNDGCLGADNVLERIRHHLPGAALRTTLMVGFPGETEGDFLELVRFVERAEFDHLGVFAFSPEAGCRAARFPNPVPREIREGRRGILMEVQRGISRRKLMSKVGKVLPVLIEGYHPETRMLLRGRLPSQAPEADGMVMVTEGAAVIGGILAAEITAAHDYDVEARLVEGRTLPLGGVGGIWRAVHPLDGGRGFPREKF